MRKWIPLAALLLLTACTAPQAEVSPSPAPAPSEPVQMPEPSPSVEVLEEALPLLDLAEGEEVLDWASGDLDSDGRGDLAVVIDRNEEDPAGERWGRVRELYILYGGEVGYRLGERSTTLLLRSGEGGMRGDPYGGISIDNGLRICHDGGSSFGWGIDLLFTWQDGGLILTQAQKDNTYGENGTEAQWDFIQEQYTMRAISGWNDSFSGRLLYQTGLTVSKPWKLEEMESAWQIEEAVTLPPLPSLMWYDNYGRDFTGMLQHSPEEMLDKIKETYYPDMVRVDIPWAEGTWENYSAAIGGPAPSYYYTDGVQVLSYFYLEEQTSDGGQSFLQHQIMCDGPEDKDFYWLWDQTGEEAVFG